MQTKTQNLKIEVEKTQRIPSLDGLRAVAILLVICSHLVLRRHLPEQLVWLFKQFSFGDLGVRIFFVISGFLITYLLLEERAKTATTNWKAFFIRRALRILPAYFTYLIVIIFLNYFLNFGISSNEFLIAFLFLQNFELLGANWYLGHAWSLSVEEQFYLLWAFLMRNFYTLNKFWILIVILGLGSIMRMIQQEFPEQANFVLAPFLMNFDFLFCGCFAAFYFFEKDRQVEKIILKLKTYHIFFLLLMVWLFSKYEIHPGYLWLILGAGTIIAVSLTILLLFFVMKKNTPGFRLLNWKPIIFVGKISYSLYLWQQLFLSGDYWWSSFPVNLGFTLIAAFLSYSMVELPFLSMKRMLFGSQ